MFTPQVITLMILAAVVILLITEKMPMSTIGVGIIAALILTKVLEPAEALNQFSTGSIVLIANVFIISGAMMKVGVAQLIGQKVKEIVDRKGGGDKKVIFIIMLVTMSMCTSLPRIGVAGALIPIIIAIAMETKISRSKLLFIMSITASFGGSITLIGTPPNLLAKAALEEAGLGTIGFFDFAVVGIPMAIIGMIIVFALKDTKMMPNYVDETLTEDTELLEEGFETDPNLRKKQILTVTLFVIFVLSIIFEKKTGIPSYVVGMIASIILISTKTVPEKFALNDSPGWNMIFFTVGMLTLGTAMSKSGASELLANKVLGLLGSNPSPFALTAVLFLLSAGLTQVMSNTAAAGMLIPFGVSLATGMGLNPKSVIMAIVFGCNSSFMTPMATPANAMIVGEGKIKFMDWIKIGIPLMIVTFLLVIFLLPKVYPF